MIWLRELQQYLPFTVLKQCVVAVTTGELSLLQQYLPFTVLKPTIDIFDSAVIFYLVATALTVYGIETRIIELLLHDYPSQLQQHLPFTVLKLTRNVTFYHRKIGCNSTYHLWYVAKSTRQ